ncbi:MAG: hypothetical protein K0B07_04955 [DPANN group archaeon]|nr:hypothetical protein [DPANN group archaeon]
MKMVESIDLDEIYKTEFLNSKSYVSNHKLDELLEMIQKENNPLWILKNSFL